MPSPNTCSFQRLAALAAVTILAAACQSDRATSPLLPRDASLVAAAPTQKAPRLTIADVVMSATPMTLGGGATLYQITISNPGSVDATGISIRSDVDQGHGITRAGGSADAKCNGGPAGVVPPGQCTMVLGARADNAASGTGTFVPGTAKITISVNQSDGTTTKQLDSKTFKASIVAETHTGPYMSDVLPSFSSLRIGDVNNQPSYAVAVYNPTSSDQSLYGVQAYVKQGTSIHGAGGSDANCFFNAANPGTIPPGSCIFGFTTSASTVDGAPGPLVAGAAIWRLEFFYYDGVTTSTLSAREFNITLTGP